MPEITFNTLEGIYYRMMGSGPAIVLLHGFPEDGSIWEPVWTALGAKNTLLIPDLPGSGGSPLSGEMSLAAMAAGIKAIMDHEGMAKAVLAGHSMGGYVALAFATAYPVQVAGLSLVHSTPVADDDDKKKQRTKAIELILNGGKQAFIRQVVAGLFSEYFKLKEPGVVEKQVVAAGALGEDGLVNFYKSMINRGDSVALLPSAAFPVQWILGEKDTVIPFKKLLRFCYLSKVNFVSFYEDCGHMSMLECPSRLQHDVNAFSDFCHRM